MKIKTSELSGANLDWAVAIAVGTHCQETGSTDLCTGKHWVVSGFRAMRWDDWTPYTDWGQGGPLIERFSVTLGKRTDRPAGPRQWDAFIDPNFCHSATYVNFGPSPLIAACRAIVAAKLGDEVDVPEGLV